MFILLTLFCYFLIGSDSHETYYDTDMVVNITLSFASVYDTSCIRLLTDDGQEGDHAMFEIYKRIAKHLQKSAAVYSYSRYMEVSRKKLLWRTCFKPIKLLIDGESTRKKLTAISQNVRMAESLWLIIMNRSVSEYLSEVHLQFDVELIVGQVKSRDLVVFQEAYRVDNDYPLRISQFGKWTRSTGLDIPANHLYERRSDLEGKLLKVGSIENWPMSSFNENQWDGYFPRIWKEIASLINSTIKAYISRDNATGSDKGNGNWSGLVGMVLDGSIDVIAAEMSMNKQRSEVISFTRPVLISKYKIYLTAPGQELKWDAAFKPFGSDVWNALVLWVVVGTISTALCYKCSWYYGLDSNTKKIFNLTESFFFVLQTLCQQGCSRIPRSSACRIVILMCFLVSSVLIPSYSASVISSLTHEKPDRPFNTLEEMLAVGTHKLLVIPNSGQYDHFKRSEDSLNQNILKKLILTVPKENEVKSISEAINKAFCKLENYAFFSTQKIFEMKIEYNPMNCPLVAIPQDLSPVYQSLALKKHSPFLGLINFHLQKLFDAGIVNRLERSVHSAGLHNFHPIFIDVDVEDTFQIFALLISGLMLSVVLLLMEFFYCKCIHRKYSEVLRREQKHWKTFRRERRIHLDTCVE